MKDRITSDNIQELRQNEVFVFGSNEAGIHGAGAAKLALKWGAKMYQGVDVSGQTYALPTKDVNIKSLDLQYIQQYVENFIDWAKQHSETTFLVTEIGCGLANFTPQEIAPMFEKAKEIENIHLPKRFWEILNSLL